MKEGSIPAALLYRIQYKVMNTCNSRVITLETNLQGIETINSIPRPVYQQNEDKIIDLFNLQPILLLMNLMIQSKFVINKESLRNNFFPKDLQPQRNWFFKNYQNSKRVIIKEIYYIFLEKVKLNILFF